MADPIVAPALGSFAIGKLLEVMIKNAKTAYKYRDECEELAQKLEGLIGIVKQLEESASKTNHAECKKWLKHFEEILTSAKTLTDDCSKESIHDKAMRMLTFWKWKKLRSCLEKIKTQIDEAKANASLYVLGIILSTTDENCIGFLKQDTPSLIVGVDEHFNKLKTSILQSHGRVDRSSIFGLHGRGGAGKTLLAQMLNNDIDIREMYGQDSIIWMTIGLDAEVDDLYKRMGKCRILDSSVSKMLESLPNKEDQRMFLKEAFAKKKVLLILDDVWQKEYDYHNMMYWLDVAKAPGSTILITSRSETILRKAGAEINVVLSLNDDESWKLFSSHAFDDGGATLKTIPEEIARAICEECKGLPLALKVIGSAMMDKMEIEEWESALLDFQQSRPISDSSVDSELFGSLQLSFKELRSDATRICFLYFAAFPEDHKIDVEDLISIWIGEELFGSNLITKEAKRLAYDELRKLAKRCLIDWNKEEKYVHIHDILRDLALYMIENAKPGECAYECLFYSGEASISFPARERVVGLKRMSFMNCKISQWPEDRQISCPKVKVCILQNTTIMDVGAPLEIFKNMMNLRVLDLSRNSFVPQDELVSITNFEHLRKLNLSGCGSLTGLPVSISNLKCLTELDLSSCGSLTELPESFGNLKCLTELDLRTCEFLMGLPESIGNLKCLTKLDLGGCGSLTRLPNSISNLKCLTQLDLSWCGSLMELPESFGNLKCLTELDLGGCELLTGLLESIGNLNCLTTLELDGCGSLTGLPESFGNLKCLVELDLRACYSVTGIPESIGNLKSLTKLYLNRYGSLTDLPESIGNLKCLTELDLEGCESLIGLPKSIGNLKCLTELNLRDCRSMTRLQESIGNLKCLTGLNLRGCTSMISLPESIGNLKSVTKLNLTRCESLLELPESIGNLKYLLVLDLEGCGYLMGLPESIGNLESLTKLNLSYCRSLTGLPESIGNLDCLTELYLRKCESLTGLPESIGNLKSLTMLCLTFCGSTTRLLESIGNLTCLTLLDLEGCGSLTGLPESIGNLKCLKELYLPFCGSLTRLPESIGNLKCLTVLHLEGCGSLTRLPESIGNLKCLMELNLKGCGCLTGLPKSINGLKCLTHVDLEGCGSRSRHPESIDNLGFITGVGLEMV